MNVGELIAYLRLDDSQFQSGMGRSKNAFSGLMNVAKAAGQVVATGLTTGAVAGGTLLTALMKTGLGYNSLQQNSRAALATMLGGAQAANAQMDKLDEFARSSPFAKQVFIQAQQQMLGFGVATEKVLPALNAVQNAVAATGGSSDAIQNITYALSQMQAQGKFSGETLRDLGVYGIDAATIIGEKMGLTGEEIRKMASKPGGIPVGEVWDPLVEGLTEKFGGATDNIKQQWSGALDRIKGAWRDIGATLAKPFIDPNGGGRAVEWANLVADGLRGIEKHVKAAAPIVEKALGPAFERVETGIRKANVAIAAFNLQGAIRQVKQLSDYTPLVAASTTALTMLGLRPLPVIGGLASGMWPLVGAIAALVATDPQLRGLGDAFQTGLGDAGSTVNDIVVAVADLAMGLLGELTPGLLASAEGAGKLAGLGIELASSLVDILTAGLPVVGMASDLVGWLSQLPAPVLAGVAAFAAFKALGIPTIFKKVGSGALDMGRSFKSGAGTVAAYAWTAAQGMDGLKLAGSGVAGALGKVAATMKTAFVSNLPMLAISALVGILGAFAQASANAKARADAYATAMEGVASSADKAAAAAEVATSAFATGENADWGWYQKMSTGYESVADALDAVGSSATAAGDAVAGSQSEFDAYVDSLWAIAEASPETTTVIRELVTKVNQQRNSMTDAARANQQKQRSDEEAAAAAEAHTAALQRQQEAADRLRLAEQDLAAAKGDLVSAQYASKDALDEWNQVIGETEHVTRDASGAIDTTTDSYRKFDEAALSAQQAMTRELEAMVKAGASQADLNAKRDEFLGKQRANIEAWGLEGAEVDSYVDRIGGIPEVKSLKIDANTEEGAKKVEAFLAELAEKKGDLLIDANENPALERLAHVLGLVEVEEGIFQLNADENPALAKLLATLGIIDTSTGTVTVAGDNAEANAAIQEALDFADGSTGTPTIDGDNRLGKNAVNEVTTLANNARPKVLIGGNNQPGKSEANLLEAYINRKAPSMGISAYDNGATATAQRIASTIASMSFSVPIMAGQGGITRADGGLVESFANGGYSGGPEQHIASYVPAGTWRVFGEDETGGEWYIPRAMSKRSRSLQIAAQMVDEFGYQMIPKNSQAFADGSTNPPASSSTESLMQVIALLSDEQIDRLCKAFETGATRIAREWS